MIIKNWKKEIFSIPNLLSMFRLVLIPVYIVLYLKEYFYLSAAILAVSCLTDLIDGKIARHFNMVTTLGIILDPFADKATQFALIVCLAIKHPVLFYLIGLFVLKEGFQLIAGGVTLLKKGKMLGGALIAGKVCTTVLFISLILMVMLPDLSDQTVTIITIVDIAFMMVSFVCYILAYFGRNKKVRDIPGKE